MTTTPAGQQPPTAPVLGAWQPLHHAGASHTPNPMYDKLIYGRTISDWAIRIVLVLVMTAALAVGTWSIYTLLTQQLAAPKPIAILGCGMFDISALFFALLSQRYAVTTDSGLAPRLAMLAMISTSAWVNWMHGQMEGWGIVGSVILAAAPVIAELAFEMFHRFAHRETLRSLGRVAQTLPVLGKWAWLAHPIRSRKAIDAHIRAALTEHEAVASRRTELAEVRAATIVQVPIAPQVELNRIPEPAPAVPEVHEPEPVQVPGVVREPAKVLEPAEIPAEPQVREPTKPRTSKPNPTSAEPANLTDRAANKQNQIDQVLNLIDELGYDAVKLGLVMERTGLTKTTAYHRLNDARAQWRERNAA